MLISSQEVKIQEHTDSVPTGGIPRTVSVYCLGDLTRYFYAYHSFLIAFSHYLSKPGIKYINNEFYSFLDNVLLVIT